MKYLHIILFIALADHALGASDYHVEQFHGDRVEAIDPGTHMTNRGSTGWGRSQEFNSFYGGGFSSPITSSSQQEFHQEQQFVDGQKVYDRRHERRYQDGRLIHDDNQVSGQEQLSGMSYGNDRSAGYRSSSSSSAHEIGQSSYGFGAGDSRRISNIHDTTGGNYGSETASNYGSTSSISENRGSGYGRHHSLSNYGSDFEENFRSDVERLRQQLHGGSTLSSTPTNVASYRSESNRQSHFVDGQQVYHREAARKYEDGNLVYNVTSEQGSPNTGMGIGGNMLNNRQESSSSSSTNQAQHESNQQYSPGLVPSYRASYSGPGTQTTRRISTNRHSQANQVSSHSTYPASTSYRNSYQNSYTSLSRNRNRAGISRPTSTYRASYTPSSSARRVTQRPNLNIPSTNSQISTETRRQSSYSTEYQPTTYDTSISRQNSQINTENIGRRTSYQDTSNHGQTTSTFSDRSNFGSLSHQQPASTHAQSTPRSGAGSILVTSHQPVSGHTHSSDQSSSGSTPSASHQSTSRHSESSRISSSQSTSSTSYQPVAHSTSSSRRRISTAYGSSTESPIAPENRITDTYSEPYSLRSSSYQPSRFANYSAWSHWQKESNLPSTYNAGTYSSRSQYGSTNSNYHQLANQYGTLQTTTQRPSENVYEESDMYNTGRRYRYGTQDISYRTSDALQTTTQRPSENVYEESDMYNTGRRYRYGTQDISYRTSDDRIAGYDHSSNQPTSTSTAESSTSARTYTSNSLHTRSGSGGIRPGGQLDLALTVNARESNGIRTGSISGNKQIYFNQERNALNISVSAGNEMETDYSTNDTSRSMPTFESTYGDTHNLNENRASPLAVHSHGSDRSESVNNYLSSSSSNFGTTRITNRTPLITSYKLETRTSRRYLNGKVVSEIKYNRYFENGQLVHENSTHRSRDEMATDGVNLALLDLTFQDLQNYGILESESVPMSHSQRFEMRQEMEFENGLQISEKTHETHFQDGELVYENHSDKDQNDLLADGRNIQTGSFYNSGFYNRASSNYGSNLRLGDRQNTGVGETVMVSVTPITRTRQYEVRRQQEFRDGEQVYGLHHERHYTDGNLVHEALSQQGPDDFDSSRHRDALYDIISGRTITTASNSGYNPNAYNTLYRGESSNQESSYSVRGSSPSLEIASDSLSHSNSNHRDSSYREYSSGIQENEESRGQVGTNLLKSGCLSCVIGGGGISSLDSLSNAPSLSVGSEQGSSSSRSSLSNTYESSRHGGGYTSSVGNENTGYDHTRSSGIGSSLTKIHGSSTYDRTSSSSSAGSTTGSNQVAGHRTYYGTEGQGSEISGYGSLSSNYGSQNSIYGGSAVTRQLGSSADMSSNIRGHDSGYGQGYGQGYTSHRREMELEEHYENGVLVSGREENARWRDGQLVHHQNRRYGQGEENRNSLSSSNSRGASDYSSPSSLPSSSSSSSYSKSSSYHSSSSSIPQSRVFQNSVEGVCASNPCANGGSCITGTRGYLCICTFGFRGRRCVEAYCPTRYCRHEGICEVTGEGEHSCSCPVTYTGPRCEHRVRRRRHRAADSGNWTRGGRQGHGK